MDHRVPNNGASIYAITLPPKVWRPKSSNKCIPIEYADDIDDGVFDYFRHGKIVYRPKQWWYQGTRKDLIVYNEDVDKKKN